MMIEVGNQPLFVGGVMDSCPTCGKTWQYHANEPQGMKFAERWIEHQRKYIRAHKAICYIFKRNREMLDQPGVEI